MRYILPIILALLNLTVIAYAQEDDQLAEWFPDGHGLNLENPIEANEDWTPVEQDFGDVIMVLVPAGCFMMGSEDGTDDEKPIHEQCFDTPFWIDRFEVTNVQFGSPASRSFCTEDSSQPQQPRNCVNWFEARDFCEERGARLPTEPEWEYAARGPAGLLYPWGNEFVSDNAIYLENSNDDTAEVDERPQGASWVGAEDMSGNVSEWVSSAFSNEFPYPYDAEDGREDPERMNVRRVLRGGSFNFGEDFLRASSRYSTGLGPLSSGDFVGFRCARSLE